MTVEKMSWVGDRIHIHHHLFDPDGIHETIILYPAEALEILGWLLQEQKQLLRLYAEAQQKEGQAS